jgi:hypothetical protein
MTGICSLYSLTILGTAIIDSVYQIIVISEYKILETEREKNHLQ